MDGKSLMPTKPQTQYSPEPIRGAHAQDGCHQTTKTKSPQNHQRHPIHRDEPHQLRTHTRRHAQCQMNREKLDGSLPRLIGTQQNQIAHEIANHHQMGFLKRMQEGGHGEQEHERHAHRAVRIAQQRIAGVELRNEIDGKGTDQHAEQRIEKRRNDDTVDHSAAQTQPTVENPCQE